jgi:hypothetical protein
MSWCLCGLVSTPLGRCLAVCVPDGSELLTGKVNVRLAPLCRLIASMLSMQPESTAERQVCIGALTVLVRACAHFSVALVLTHSAHAPSAGLAAAHLAHAIEACAGEAIRLASLAGEEAANEGLGAYTASSALNGATDAADAELSTLPQFAQIESGVLRPALCAPPWVQLWLQPTLAQSEAVCAAYLLGVDDTQEHLRKAMPTHPSSSPRVLLDACASDPIRGAHAALVAHGADERVWTALCCACSAQAGTPDGDRAEAASFIPLALPGLARGRSALAGTGRSPLRAVGRRVPLDFERTGFVILFYTCAHSCSTTPSSSSTLQALPAQPAQAAQGAHAPQDVQVQPARARSRYAASWWPFASRPRVQPRPHGEESAGAPRMQQSLVVRLEREPVPDQVAAAFSALCERVGDAYRIPEVVCL